MRAQLPQCPQFVLSQSPCLSFKAISAPHPWFKGGGGERWHRHETDTGPSPDPTLDTSGSSSPSFLRGRAFHIQTSLDLQHSPGVLLIPVQHLKLVSLTALSPPSNRSRYHNIWSLLRSCCTDPGGSCSQPAPISLLRAGNTNPCSAPGAAALLRLGSGIDLCLDSPGEFGSQLRMVLARTDREQTDFLPHGIAGRKQ